MTDTYGDPLEDDDVMVQRAPMPAILGDMVRTLKYKEGWAFRLDHIDRGQGSSGLTLFVFVKAQDTYHPREDINVVHYMPVPPAAYDARSWRRWLLDQVLLVEQHEACEWFRFGGWVDHNDDRPYAPSHGPGNNPYMIREVGTEVDQRTSFRGEVKEPAYRCAACKAPIVMGERCSCGRGWYVEEVQS